MPTGATIFRISKTSVNELDQKSLDDTTLGSDITLHNGLKQCFPIFSKFQPLEDTLPEAIRNFEELG